MLPKVGSTLNCKETVEALGDRHCPVPQTMFRIMTTAGADAVLAAALKDANPEIRSAAEHMVKHMPKPASAATALPKP